MAKALECPACGARHGLDSLPDARTFRCDRCGQVLKVPESVAALQRASRPRDGATPATGGGGGAVPLAPPPRRRGSAAGARVTVTATAALPATAAALPDAAASPAAKPAPERVTGTATKVRWYWRLLAWVVAVPLGLLITGWPARRYGLISGDDLLDVFVGEGSGRYLRLLVFAAVWALVTALLVQLLVEGGRWWSRRRRARARTRTPVPV